MQIILTLEPIEIIADLGRLEVDPIRLAQAARDGIAQHVAHLLRARQADEATIRAVAVRTYVPPSGGVVSIEFNPF